MSGGGFVRLPDGSVIVALTLPRPRPAGAAPRSESIPRVSRSVHRRRLEIVEEAGRRRWSAAADEPHTVRAAAPRRRHGEEPRVRVLVHSGNRARALTRLRNLGLRAVYLNGNAEPPTADEVTAVLHHPEGLVWRAVPEDEAEPWHPIASLLRVGTA